jgi:hypothetical protein
MTAMKARPWRDNRRGRTIANASASDLKQQIADLASLERAALEVPWQANFGKPPPRRASRELMVRTLAHQLQLDAFGGLDAGTARRLDELVAAVATGKELKPAPSSPRLRPGVRLIREWQGEMLEVLVLEEGFAFRGRLYSSLSRLAYEITGTKWNGYRFFGLKSRRTGNGRVANQAAKADA